MDFFQQIYTAHQ